MKNKFLLVFFSTYILSASAQQGEWIWLHGDSITGSAGSYDTIGVTSPTNDPAGMYEPCQWTDTNGNFWLYGGYDNNGNILNDLWKYDPSLNEWTWVNGTHTVNDLGSYGSLGVPSSNNRPPSKSLASVSWVDGNNNLWMFGGGNASLQIYNDLWKYDIAANVWTWMKGSNTPNATGIYGVYRTPNPANTPGAREETSVSWVDNAGDLWFFGGFTSGTGNWNDLWRFNIATNTWTWMNGSKTGGVKVHYGVKGAEAAANTPGGLWAYSSWKDATGNLWFWGGVGQDSTSAYGVLNDMWRYNPVTNNWTWINGDAKVNVQSRFGTQCTASPNNVPGGRYENRSSWTDTNGNFWTFGGLAEPSFPMLNDLWMYCVATNEWMWVNGDSTLNSPGVWGQKGIANPANRPRSRAGAVSWTDNKGHLYLFGGEFKNTNDLWEYTIDNSCSVCGLALPVASFQSDDSAFCENNCANFTNLSLNATSWQWSFPGGQPSSSTVQNPHSICYINAGNYSVTLIATNSGGSDTLTNSNFITVQPAPPAPVIMQQHDTLYFVTDTSYSTYQWYEDSTVISGGTDTFLVVTHNGNYNLRVTSKNSCFTATGIIVNVGIKEFSVSGLQFTLSPNPVTNKLFVNGYSLLGRGMLKIYNTLGEVCQQSPINKPQYEIDVSLLPSGIYFLELSGENGRWAGRFVKQ